MQQLQIRVPNFTEYNKRSDVKHSSWFRVEHKYLLGSKHHGTHTLESSGAFLLILSMCSEQESDTIKIVPEQYRSFTRTPWNKFLAACEILRKQEVIEIIAEQRRDEDVTLRTNERTNGETLFFDPGMYPEEKLLTLYEIYPRKEGKKKGMAALKKIVRSDEQFERVKRAIENYLAQIRKNGTDPKFIKHFATFVNNWEDYDWKQPAKPARTLIASAPPKPFKEVLAENKNPDAIYDGEDLL